MSASYTSLKPGVMETGREGEREGRVRVKFGEDGIVCVCFTWCQLWLVVCEFQPTLIIMVH